MKTATLPDDDALEFDRKAREAVAIINSKTRYFFASVGDAVCGGTQFVAASAARFTAYQNLCDHFAWKGELQLSPDTSGIQSPIDAFLDEVYAFEEAGNIRAGIRKVFGRVNEWLVEGHISICDVVLEKVDVNRLGVDIALSFLTITRAARDVLRKRSSYLDRARQRITELRGKDVATRLLENMSD